jgi:hypothetical protein
MALPGPGRVAPGSDQKGKTVVICQCPSIFSIYCHYREDFLELVAVGAWSKSVRTMRERGERERDTKRFGKGHGGGEGAYRGRLEPICQDGQQFRALDGQKQQFEKRAQLLCHRLGLRCLRPALTGRAGVWGERVEVRMDGFVCTYISIWGVFILHVYVCTHMYIFTHILGG